MSLNSTKVKQNDHGFTIVELLVVIVVIGILAAITIVSYTGITSKANSSSDKQDASSVLSSALAYYVDNNSTFLSTLTTAGFNTNNTAKIPSDITMTAGVLTAGSTIQYQRNAAGTGICVGYWDYATGSALYLLGGTAASAANVTPSCT
jgi:prepilin-type N-terminal cleavage/methylation domain-containing protein